MTYVITQSKELFSTGIFCGMDSNRDCFTKVTQIKSEVKFIETSRNATFVVTEDNKIFFRGDS
jgi:hypothetical protein